MHSRIKQRARAVVAGVVSLSLLCTLCPLSRVALADDLPAQDIVLDDAVELVDDEPIVVEDTNLELVEEEPITDEVIVDDDPQEDLETTSVVYGPNLQVQSDEGLPSKFDLRDRGVVTPVKLQNPWGTCWSFSATSAAETSILSKMGATYADTGLDLSERHLAWYVTQPVTKNISSAQAGEGLSIYNHEAGPNHVFTFGGAEECAATLYAQGIGPMPERDYPYKGAEGLLAYEDLLTRKDDYIALDIAALKENYHVGDDVLRQWAEEDYETDLALYKERDVYSPLDDWTISEPDEPGSGKLKGSPYTLTDNNVITYWTRHSEDDGYKDTALVEKYGGRALCEQGELVLYQKSVDQIKEELLAGRGVSVGIGAGAVAINADTWSIYNNLNMVKDAHAVCIVGWDDEYSATNFTHTKDAEGNPVARYGTPLSTEKAEEFTTPPGDGAWIIKNSWGSQTDLIPGGLVGSDGTTKDANVGNWGIVDKDGNHTGYAYLSYYDSYISVPESFDFDLRNNNDQQNALQLDYLPASAGEWYVHETSPVWEANIFSLDKDMRIDEVATRIKMTDEVPLCGFSVTFDLYKLGKNATKPDDGTHLATCTREFASEGYHRAALDNPVYLRAGDRLGIVVQQRHVLADGSTLYGASTQMTDIYRQIHHYPVYGEAIVNEGESFLKVEGVTDKEDASKDGWFDTTSPITESLYWFLNYDDDPDSFYTQYKLEHAVGTPLNDYYSFDNFCIKAFGEPTSLEHVDAVAATCKKAGSLEYWRDSVTGEIFSDENGTKKIGSTAVAALGHSWGKVTYTWSSSNKKLVATRACKNDPSHVQKATAKVTSAITKEPTETKAGRRTYTGTFNVSWAKTQAKNEPIAALGMPGVLSWARVQGRGWYEYKPSKACAGTTGKSLGLQAFTLQVTGAHVTGGIEYRSHVQGTGWQLGWKRDGLVSGANGSTFKRLEATQIRLYGQMAKSYDVYYRMHVQGYGWMGWAKNGQKAGTQGASKRAEAIQVVLVKKGSKAPGKTYNGVKQTYAKAFVAK